MDSGESPYFDLTNEDDVTILKVVGPEIRHPTPAAEFAADVVQLVAAGRTKKLLLNLGDVQYMSSTGFAALMSLARKVEQAGGQVKLCNLDPDVQVGANIIGLGRIVEIHPDEDAALDRFATT